MDKLEEVKKKAIAIKVILGTSGCILPFVFGIMIIFTLLMALGVVKYTRNNIRGYGNFTYVEGACSEVVTENTSESSPSGLGIKTTYSLEEYVAGVVAHEVGAFNDLETFKAFAVAARTFLMAQATRNSDGTCYLLNSTKKQTFEEVSLDSLYYQAAMDTAGVVLVDSSGNYVSTMYDAFCWTDKDDDYYYVCQKGQKIPTSWVVANVPRLSGSAFIYNAQYKSHGKGMSQDGAYYLATEKGYTYDELLSYYYDDIEFGTVLSSFVPATDLSVGGGYVTDSLPIASNPSSMVNVNDYNNYISSQVNSAGRGTSAGVVAAGRALVDYMAQTGYRLPYVLGGGHGSSGYGFSSPMDCSSFVSWAIRNGGFNFPVMTTATMWSMFSGSSCNLSDINCVGQPGDLLLTNGTGHVILIIGSYQSNGLNYYQVVHAANSAKGIVYDTYNSNSTSSHAGRVYKVIKMSSWYNNPANIT